jgi:hypothetical protein
MPDSDGESYLERFEKPIWRDLLITVHSMVGPHFQGVLAKFNQQDPTTIVSRQKSTLVSAITKAIRHAPEIAQNRALRSDQALDALMTNISPIILVWASEQCTEALRIQRLGQAPPWPPSVLQSVTSELEKLNTLLPQPNPVRRTLPWAQSNVICESLSQDWPSSPPTIEQVERLQGQSPIVSESGAISDSLDNMELPPLSRPKTMNFEMGEDELRRRKRDQRQPSSRVWLHKGTNASSKENPLPLEKATTAIPTDGEIPWPSKHPRSPPGPLSKNRGWRGRPAAKSKLYSSASGQDLRPRRPRSHQRSLELEN